MDDFEFNDAESEFEACHKLIDGYGIERTDKKGEVRTLFDRLQELETIINH